MFNFQNTRFQLAELRDELIMAQPSKNMLVCRLCAGKLDRLAVPAAKLWITEMQYRLADTSVQLHGGQGYRAGPGISRTFTFARLERIKGGTSEIRKGRAARYL